VRAIFPLLLAALGCSGKTLTPADVVGTWIVTPESQRRLIVDARTTSPRLVLREDGVFVASSLPEELLYSRAERHDGLVDATGRWRLTVRDRTQQVELDVLSMGGIERSPYSTELWIAFDRSDARLYYDQGDPDEGRRIEFAKQ
jgi:hypothetical protein